MSGHPDAMIDLPLSINDPLELQILDEKDRLSCASRVHDLVAGQIQLSWPTRSGVRVPVRKSQELALFFTRSDGIYNGRAIVEAVSPGPIPTITVSPLEGMERIQRREYFRVRISLPVKLAGATSPSDGLEANRASGLHLIGRTVDISGGGLSIHKEFPVLPGTEFKMWLTLEEKQPPLELVARVIYSEPIKTFQGRHLYRVAMAFVGISEAYRRLIIKHIFRVQQTNMLRLSESQQASEH